MRVASGQVGELPAIAGLRSPAYKACTATEDDPPKSLQGGSRGFEPLSAHREPQAIRRIAVSES
jgi:hypothetical protein